MSADKMTDISKTALQAANFQEIFLAASENSLEKGALTVIAFAADMSHRGVPLKEAFQTVCGIVGIQSNSLPRQLERCTKPSENAEPLEHNFYRIKIAGNALSLARAVLDGDKTYRNDHRIDI